MNIIIGTGRPCQPHVWAPCTESSCPKHQWSEDGCTLCAELCRWLVWFQKGPKRLKAETWGTGCLEVSMVQLCIFVASQKITQQKKDRKIGLLFSRFRFEGWHCLVWWTPGVSASVQVLRFPASFHVLDAAKHPYPRCWSERRFQQKWWYPSSESPLWEKHSCFLGWLKFVSRSLSFEFSNGVVWRWFFRCYMKQTQNQYRGSHLWWLFPRQVDPPSAAEPLPPLESLGVPSLSRQGKGG